MYKNLTIAAVVPCYNEQSQIESVIDSMPPVVDIILVVDDKSRDNTVDLVMNHSCYGSRLQLIRHVINQGVGGAIASGYKWCRDHEIGIAVVMAGDGQMNPDDLVSILDPVADSTADYTKGNRLVIGNSFRKIPKTRFIGNVILSFLTKIASGYWNLSDSQTGYTAINANALNLINWDRMYKRYGQPNDLLVKLNVADMVVVDVPMMPVYDVGEVSGIKLTQVIPRISLLLIRLFIWRVKEKYVIRGLHPLIFFYLMSLVSITLSCLFLIRLVFLYAYTSAFPEVSFLIVLFTLAVSINSALFAMWFDYQENIHLNPRTPYSTLRRYFKNQ